MRRSIWILVAMLAASVSAGAQQGGRDSGALPPAYRPPPGMCRIWLTGVKPADQPAPTDCATAVRNRPANGRVIFGDRTADQNSRVARTPACASADSSCSAAPDCSKVNSLAGCAASPFQGLLKGLGKSKKP